MTLSDKKYTIIKKGIDSTGKPFQTRQLKYKQELFDKWEKELAHDFWNLDRTEEGGNTRGNERIHTFAKYMNAWEEHFGSLDPQVCNWDGCEVIVYLDWNPFRRNSQKDGKYNWYLNWNTGEAIQTGGNVRSKNYSGPEVPISEWDHIIAKDKKINMGEVIKSKSIQKIVKEMEICQLLCKMHHDIKTQKEATYTHKGKPKLPYGEAVRLIKEYIKPTSKYHFTPGKRYAHKYGKGALDEAIEKAESNNDMALYDDLKRIPRNPYVTYANEGIDTTNFWFEITGNENKDMRRNNGKT